MVYLDNNAGRLHEVISRFRSNNGQLSLGAVWADVLGVSVQDRYEIFNGLASVVRLSAQAEASIQSLALEDEELLLRWVQPVRNAMGVAHQLEQQAQSLSAHINEAHMQSLEVAARELHRSDSQPILSQDDRAHAVELVAELISVLRESEDLDVASRDLLLRHASAIQHALNLSWMLGAEGLEDALAGALGAAMMVKLAKPALRGSW